MSPAEGAAAVVTVGACIGVVGVCLGLVVHVVVQRKRAKAYDEKFTNTDGVVYSGPVTTCKVEGAGLTLNGEPVEPGVVTLKDGDVLESNVAATVHISST